MSVELRTADLRDFEWIEQAVPSCPVAMAEFGGFYGCATTKLLPLVNDRREVLMIMTGAELPVGFVDVDAESDPVDALNVSWFVAPEFRGRGIATQALKLLADTRPGWQLIAAVRPPNIPSLAWPALLDLLRSDGVSGERSSCVVQLALLGESPVKRMVAGLQSDCSRLRSRAVRQFGAMG